ncbi:17265_t:CDS:2, partial [Racocetra persica]
KKYDDLAIIRPHETPQQWAIHIKDDLQELCSRERPRWRRFGYEIKFEDLMQYHWNNECFNTEIQNENAQLIQNIMPIESIKIKSFMPSLIHSLTPPLPPKPVAYIQRSVGAPSFIDVDEYWAS